MKKVLWLTSWYPDRMDNYDGDFIQRHARAVALYCKVHVIYLKRDTSMNANEVLADTHHYGNLTEQRIYYNSVKTGLLLLDKFISQLKYRRLYSKALTKYKSELGLPDLMHVHVAMKAGLTAIRFRKKWKIPYILTEHWTAYLPEAEIQIGSFSPLFVKLMKRVFSKAAQVTVVSDYLGKAIQQHMPDLKYQVIPNVVNTDIFYPAPAELTAVPRLIHISNMNYQKNTEGILKAVVLLKDTIPLEMHLYGRPNVQLEKMVDGLHLQKQVFFKGEVPQSELAESIRQSDGLVLFSRYETFGCVIIEANACGKPVIVSDLEVFHELISQGVNGLFVKDNDHQALAETIRSLVKNRPAFDSEGIARMTAEKYNYKTVGKMFLDLYNSI